MTIANDQISASNIRTSSQTRTPRFWKTKAAVAVSVGVPLGLAFTADPAAANSYSADPDPFHGGDENGQTFGGTGFETGEGSFPLDVNDDSQSDPDFDNYPLDRTEFDLAEGDLIEHEVDEFGDDGFVTSTAQNFDELNNVDSIVGGWAGFATETIVGTDGNDKIYVVTEGRYSQISVNDETPLSVPSDRHLVIRGLAGDDLIVGGVGDETLLGGPGKDTLIGNLGNDKIFGGPGNDTLFGGPGIDRLAGGPGHDRLRGGPGNDDLDGGPGVDIVSGDSGQDNIELGFDFIWLYGFDLFGR